MTADAIRLPIRRLLADGSLNPRPQALQTEWVIGGHSRMCTLCLALDADTRILEAHGCVIYVHAEPCGALWHDEAAAVTEPSIPR